MTDNVEFPPTKGQWKCDCGWTNHELRMKCRHCYKNRKGQPEVYLTADEVMEEVSHVASGPVFAALRITYEGKFRSDLKGTIPDVVLRDLALEPITVYRRTCPKEDAPIYKRKREKDDS